MTKIESMHALEREIGVMYRRIRKVVADRAREVHPDLQAGGYSMVSMLGESGPKRSSDIAELFCLDKGAVSRQVQQLHDLGLVDRATDPADGRASIISISALGEQRLKEVAAARRRTLNRRLEGWSKAELDAFVESLARYNSTLG